MGILDNNREQNDYTPPQALDENRFNAILHEIHHALALLIDQSQPTVIDLLAFPFAPGDEARLLEYLGKGEVSIAIDTLGNSSITETAYSGVWLVDHRNEQDERIAFQLEIAEIPALVLAPKSEIKSALDTLSNHLRIELGPVSTNSNGSVGSENRPIKA